MDKREVRCICLWPCSLMLFSIWCIIIPTHGQKRSEEHLPLTLLLDVVQHLVHNYIYTRTKEKWGASASDLAPWCCSASGANACAPVSVFPSGISLPSSASPRAPSFSVSSSSAVPLPSVSVQQVKRLWKLGTEALINTQQMKNGKARQETTEAQSKLPVSCLPTTEAQGKLPVSCLPTTEAQGKLPVSCLPTTEAQGKLPVSCLPTTEAQGKLPVSCVPTTEAQSNLPVSCVPTTEAQSNLPVSCLPTTEAQSNLPVSCLPTTEAQSKLPVSCLPISLTTTPLPPPPQSVLGQVCQSVYLILKETRRSYQLWPHQSTWPPPPPPLQNIFQCQQPGSPPPPPPIPLFKKQIQNQQISENKTYLFLEPAHPLLFQSLRFLFGPPPGFLLLPDPGLLLLDLGHLHQDRSPWHNSVMALDLFPTTPVWHPQLV